MQIKSESRTLRLLMCGFVILPLSFLCIQICSILLHCKKVTADGSVKLFALESDSYFNPKLSFQNVIPVFSKRVISHVTLTSILPTLSDYWRTFGGCLPVFMIQPRYLASVNFLWLVLSFFSVLQYHLPVWYTQY